MSVETPITINGLINKIYQLVYHSEIKKCNK